MSSTIAAAISAAVSLAIIAAVAVLTWHGSITGEAALGVFATFGALGAGAGVYHVAAKTTATVTGDATQAGAAASSGLASVSAPTTKAL